MQSENPPILAVDDDAGVRNVVHRLAERLGHSCDLAVDGDAALRLVTAPGAPRYAVMVLDLHIPGVDAVTLVEAVRAALPGLAVLVVSGYDAEAAAPVLALGRARFLQKPFSIADFTSAFEALIE